MYLESPKLDISFRLMYEDTYYMVYTNSKNIKCFECGDNGHKREGGSGVGAEPANSKPKQGQQSYAGALMNAAALASASSADLKRAAEVEEPGGDGDCCSPL